MAQKRWDISEVVAVRDAQQAAQVDGTLLDTFSAPVVLGVFEALSPGNQERAQTLPFGKFATWAWTMVGVSS